MINLNSTENASGFEYTTEDYPPILNLDYEVIRGYSQTGFKEIYQVKNIPGKNEEIISHIFTLPNRSLIEGAPDLIKERIDFFDSRDCPALAKILCHNTEVTDDSIRIGIVYEASPDNSLAVKMGLKPEEKDLVNKRLEPGALKKISLMLCDALRGIHAINDGVAGGEKQWHLGLNPFSVHLSTDRIILSDFMLEYRVVNFGRQEDDMDTRWDLLWAAPEVISQQWQRIGPWSDIWSFGIIFYQLMGEHFPFAGESVSAKLVSICHNSDNKKRLNFLPFSLKQVVNKCLDKEPMNRYRSFDDLKRDLETAEFIKTCGAAEAHENEYYTLKCHCGAGFSHLKEQGRGRMDGKKWCRKFNWPDTLAPGASEAIEVNLDLVHHHDFYTFKEFGQKFRISVTPKNRDIVIDDIILPFLPPPRFDIQERKIATAYDPSSPHVSFDLLLKLVESEAVIENITARIGDVEISDSNIIFRTDSARIKKGSPGIPVTITVRQDLLELDRENDLCLKVKLKNRKEPLDVDHAHIQNLLTFTLTNPPDLVFIPNEEFLSLVLFRDVGVTSAIKEIKLSNTGSTRIELNRVEMGETARGDGLQQPKFIKAVHHDSYIEAEYTGEIRIEIDPSKLTDKSHNCTVRITFQYFYQGKWEEKTIEKQVIFSPRNLKEGELLAIDFGTTNTYCAAITDSEDPDARALNLRAGERNSDGVIPSVIKYSGFTEYAIGINPRNDYQFGRKNVFKSFKRQFASREKLFNIIAGKGESRNFDAEHLVKDYIGKLIDTVKVEHGLTFGNFIFTHPSNMDVNQLTRFKNMFQGLGIDPARCVFIDEARSSAIYSVIKHGAEWTGKYRLLVYDFGGGTTDMTYFLVDNNGGRFTVDTIDISGLPEFGGDDLTDIVFNQSLSFITGEHLYGEEKRGKRLSLLMPKAFRGIERISYDPRFEEECRYNLGHLKIEADRLKIRMSREAGNEEDDENVRLSLYYYDEDRKLPGLESFDLFVKRESFYEEARSKLQESVRKTLEMIIGNEKEIDGAYAEEPIHIVLSGRSSALFLVKKMFSEIVEAKQLNVEDITHSDLLKECVAKGASYYYFSKTTGTDFIRIRGGEGVNQIRIGLRTMNPTLGTGLGFVFKELVPVNRTLIPTTMVLDEVDLAYALGEIDFGFSFDSRGRLSKEVELFQHSGSNTQFNKMVCNSIGKYNLEEENVGNGRTGNVEGRLRVEVYEGPEIKVRARINGKWESLVRV